MAAPPGWFSGQVSLPHFPANAVPQLLLCPPGPASILSVGRPVRPLPGFSGTMRQVLFHIPIRLFGDDPDGIAVYGFGMMLVLAYLSCSWLAGRLGKREGVAPEHLQDLGIWLLISGL